MNNKPYSIIDMTDFFDPYNIEHLKAYRYLQKHGKWPIDFAIELCSYNFPNTWQVTLMGKMADAWVKSKLDK